MTQEEIWRSNGQDCGYPTCCIDAFVDRGLIFRRTGEIEPLTDDQLKASAGSGFVPCPVCAKKIVDGMPIGEIIKDRAAFLPPFPLG